MKELTDKDYTNYKDFKAGDKVQYASEKYNKGIYKYNLTGMSGQIIAVVIHDTDPIKYSFRINWDNYINDSHWPYEIEHYSSYKEFTDILDQLENKML